MIDFAIYETKMGYFIMKYENEHLTYFKKLNDENIADFGRKTNLTDKAYLQLLEYLDGKRKESLVSTSLYPLWRN